jgi:hypothetical protein
MSLIEDGITICHHFSSRFVEESRETVQSFSQERNDLRQRFEELQAAKLQLENDLSNKQEVIWFIKALAIIFLTPKYILKTVLRAFILRMRFILFATTA